MRQLFSGFYRNFSLIGKLTVIIWSFTAMVTFLILLVFGVFYRNTIQQEAEASSRRFTENSAKMISTNYTNIIEHFVYCYGTNESASDFRALNDPERTYFYKRDLLQNEMNLMNSSNYLVQGTIVISNDGKTCYVSYSSPSVNMDTTFIGLEELQACQSITWLSERPSPFRSANDVLPLAFSLYFDRDGHLRLVDSGSEGVVGYVVVLLDCGSLSKSLASAVDTDSDRSFMLVEKAGHILYANDDAIPQELADAVADPTFLSDCSSGKKSASSYRIFWADLENSNIRLIHYAKKITFSDVLPSVSVLFLSVVVTVLFVLYLMSVLISRYVTKPVNILVGMIQKIKNNCYTDYIRFTSNDELGILCRAINEMHDTIQEQIVQIRHKEAEKYKTELQLLTEQINPHFLYNTLNCIQAEVRDEHNAAASEMIHDLADYLRIGLSYRDMTISVENELRHAEAYVAIMNHRFSNSILYSCVVDSALLQHPVPKSILQPLIENSITHGFRLKQDAGHVALPSVEVSLHVRDDRLYIAVTDNGVGFDIQTTECILRNDNQQHIGLHNIYSRLEMFYGKGTVTYHLSSIPYFQNQISFVVPFLPKQDATQNQKAKETPND